MRCIGCKELCKVANPWDTRLETKAAKRTAIITKGAFGYTGTRTNATKFERTRILSGILKRIVPRGCILCLNLQSG